MRSADWTVRRSKRSSATHYTDVIQSAKFHPASPRFSAGQELSGTIDVQSKRFVAEEVKLALICRYYSGRDEDPEALIWADDVMVPASQISHRDDAWRIPVSFQLPDNLRGGNIYWWELVLYAKRRRQYAFPVSIDARDTWISHDPVPVRPERRIKVHAQGKGRLHVGAPGFASLPIQLIAATLMLLGMAAAMWIAGSPLCAIGALAVAAVVFYKMMEYVDRRSHSVLEIEGGKIFFTDGKRRLRQMEASTVRAIDIVAADIAPAGPVYEIRFYTVGGKVIIAAPWVLGRARADRMVRKLEDILTGYDRNKIDALFGPQDRLNSPP